MRKLPALTGGWTAFLATPSPGDLLAYARLDATSRQAVIVLLNFGSTGAQVALPQRFRRLRPVNLLTCCRAPLDPSRGTIDVPRHEAIVLGSGIGRVCEAERSGAPARRANPYRSEPLDYSSRDF